MRARPRRIPIAIALALAAAAVVSAQGQIAAPPPAVTLSMEDAVRLAMDHNQSLNAQRLTIAESKADEVTAGLKPNPTLSLSTDGLTVFSPKQIDLLQGEVYSAGLDYTFERGDKRNKRIIAAQNTTEVTAKNVLEAARQLRFQTEQAFVNVQLAKSALDLANQDLQSFSQTVEASRARVTAGDLAEGDFLMISLQQLQFQQDVTSAELTLVQSKASLRQLMGYDNVPENFDVAGDLAHQKVAVTLDSLKQIALTDRPDLQAAEGGVRLAQAQADLELANRARSIDASVDYTLNGFGPVSTLGGGLSFELPIHDHNQGNVAHTRIAVEQARQTEDATRATVMTDVTSAFAQYQTNERVLTLYESGYLDQAKQSLDIATYIFQRGAGSLLSLLDAERTYRATQLAYRQALAAYMTSVQQLNFVVGRQVTP